MTTTSTPVGTSGDPTPDQLSQEDIAGLQAFIRDQQQQNAQQQQQYQQLLATIQQQQNYITALTAKLESAGPTLPSLSNSRYPAGAFIQRLNNPIPRPNSCNEDGVDPGLFDLGQQSAVIKVRSALGIAQFYEVETLACSLSYQHDLAEALLELAPAVKAIPFWGPSGTPTVEHTNLQRVLDILADKAVKIKKIVEQRYSLLTAAALKPNNKALLQALTARVRGTLTDTQVPDPEVREAVLDLEADRAAALFKEAAKLEAAKFHNPRPSPYYPRGPGGGRGGRGEGPGGRNPGPGGRGRGRGRGDDASPSADH